MWVYGKDQCPIYTIYYQGMSASQLGLARYTGAWGFVATTNETYTAPRALEAIRFPFVGVDSADVVLTQLSDYQAELPGLCRSPLLWIGRTVSDFMWELYGLRAVPSGCCIATAKATDQLHGRLTVLPRKPDPQESFRANPSNGMSRSVPILTLHHHVMRMDRMNFGQRRDIACHNAKWQILQALLNREATGSPHQQPAEPNRDPASTETSVIPNSGARCGGDTGSDPQAHRKAKGKEKVARVGKEQTTETPDVAVSASPPSTPPPSRIYPCILYGVSRGAATTFNALATQQYQNVRLVILEGCYDRLRNVLRRQHRILPVTLVECGLSFATEYRPGAFDPIDAVGRIPTTVPIGFVMSFADRVTPVRDAMRLVKALRKAGHESVHVLTLWRSPHGKYTESNEADFLGYMYWLHALYQRYDLPHVPEYALSGQPLLEEELKNPQGQYAWFQDAHGERCSTQSQSTTDGNSEAQEEGNRDPDDKDTG